MQSLHVHPSRHTASQSLLPGLSSPPPAPPPSYQMNHRRLSRQRTLRKMFSSILPTLSCFIGSDETFVTTTAIAMIISMLKTFAYKAGIFLFKVNIGAAEKLPPIPIVPIDAASFPLKMPPSTPLLPYALTQRTTGCGLLLHMASSDTPRPVMRWLPPSLPQPLSFPILALLSHLQETR